MKKKIYFENLDGIRFLCFLSVFLYHSFHTDYDIIKQSELYQFIKYDLFGNGNLGVNFFFVLSGFLISYLLIEEKKLNGQINIRKFWIRRILRIWPLFYFCVFFGFSIFPQFKILFGQSPNETANPWMYVTFLNNFDFIQNGLPDASILGVLWSVAIEEQFYFFWPIILFLFPVKRYWIPFTFIILSSLIFRSLNNSPLLYEHHTLSCIGDMAVGGMGAWVIINFNKAKSIFENLKKYQIYLIYLIFIAIFLFRDDLFFINSTIAIFERAFIAIVILVIILEQNYAKNSIFKMSRFKKITQLGKITYGLYCLHFIGILTTTTISNKFSFNTELWQVMLLETSVALFITIIISSISFKYFETPFLKLKDKFSYITK